MYKNILIPIDLSHEERVGAMIKAAMLLGGKDADYVLVNVIEDIPAFVAAQLPKGVLQENEAIAIERLTEIAKEAGIKAEVLVEHGHAANSILDVAGKKGADAIVIASHKPHWDDFLIGSTAARVVRHAKCAVHVLR